MVTTPGSSGHAIYCSMCGPMRASTLYRHTPEGGITLVAIKGLRGFSQVGLSYICATAERFFAVSEVLHAMVAALPEQPSVRLLKHIIRCYLRLSDNARAREALRQCLPGLLLDKGFTACLKDDAQTRGCAANNDLYQ